MPDSFLKFSPGAISGSFAVSEEEASGLVGEDFTAGILKPGTSECLAKCAELKKTKSAGRKVGN